MDTLTSKIHVSEKPFGCDACSKRFKHQLIHHTRLHNRETVTKKFIQKQHPKRHMKTYTGEKPPGGDVGKS